MNSNLSVPDFSGDDFIDDKEIQEARKEAQAYKQMIENSLSIIKNELNLQESSHKNLKSFHMFKSLKATLLDSFESRNFASRMIVSVAEYMSGFPTAKNSNTGYDNYLFGYMEISKEYPSTYICKESFQQKIVNLFLKNDTDFAEHRKFSGKFNVLTKDGKKLGDLFRFKDLDQLSIFPEMEIEIHGNECLFRNSRISLSPEQAIQFSDLAKMLCKTLN